MLTKERKTDCTEDVAGQVDAELGGFVVVLVDDGTPEIAYQCKNRIEADAWVEEWDRNPLGIVAFVLPSWGAGRVLRQLAGKGGAA